MENQEEKSIETRLADLEKIVTDLEKQEMPLHEAFKLYKDGLKKAEELKNEMKTLEEQLVVVKNELEASEAGE